MLILPLDRRINDRLPVAVFVLAAVNAAVTFHTHFGFNPVRITSIFMEFGAIPADLKPHAWITHMFLHDGPKHVVGNLAFLLLFGMNVERRIGAVSTVALYLVSGFAALALFAAFNRDFHVPLVGASGAVSGILGMYFVLFWKRHLDVMWFAFVVGGIVRVPSLVVAAFWIGLELLQALLLNDKAIVAHWAHVGGFVGGLALTPLLMRVHKGHPERYEDRDEAPPPDRFDEKAYIPAAPAPPRADGMRLVAREWMPLSAPVRKIVDGVAPGSGAFATHASVAAGLAAPQADDLRGRLERAGFPTVVVPAARAVPVAPLVFIDRAESTHGGIAVTDARGLRSDIESRRLVRIQAGAARGAIPIVDIVARDPWRRYRLSGATADGSVPEMLAKLRAVYPGLEERGGAFDSLSELDAYFGWRLQRAD